MMPVEAQMYGDDSQWEYARDMAVGVASIDPTGLACVEVWEDEE